MEIYSENKKATFDYEILEKYEAGLVLIGQEVKSIKRFVRQVKLRGFKLKHIVFILFLPKVSLE